MAHPPTRGRICLRRGHVIWQRGCLRPTHPLAKKKEISVVAGLHAFSGVAGPLPESWSQLRALGLIDITSWDGSDALQQQVTGVLPVAWSALRRLSVLRLDTANLIGGLPLQW